MAIDSLVSSQVRVLRSNEVAGVPSFLGIFFYLAHARSGAALAGPSPESTPTRKFRACAISDPDALQTSLRISVIRPLNLSSTGVKHTIQEALV